MTRLAFLAAVVITTSCGTRVDHSEVLNAANAGRGADTGALTADGSSVAPADEGDLAGAEISTGDAQAANPAIGGGSAGRVPTGTSTPGAATAGPAGPGRPALEKRSPVVVASVSILSGVAGASIKAISESSLVWVQHINAKGGVNGHPVRMIRYDDGFDPARHRAQVQEAVEARGAIAFLSNASPVAGRSSVSYIESKRVPVIGATDVEGWFYESPMFFPEAPYAEHAYVGPLYAAAQLFPGKTKLGMVYCLEGQQCRDATNAWSSAAPSAGFEVAYKAQVSLTQPDFTAECLGARNAGVQVFLLGVDSNSVRRIAASCARQGFRPKFGTFITIIQESFQDDPNLDGMFGASNVFPWFQSGTPATDEYQDAMRTYGRSVARGIGSAEGWTQGKLFEKATANLGEPPTSEGILRGLWAISNDTLGDLTPQAITFSANKPARGRTCWFNLVVKARKWTSPDGLERHCK